MKRRGDPVGALTERERKVLALMAQGGPSTAPSQDLALSIKTVEAPRSQHLHKLDLAPDPADHRRVLAVLTFLRS